MAELSSSAWIALVCLGGLVISSGLILWSAWRQRRLSAPKQNSDLKGLSFNRAWKKEDEQLAELSRRVKNLTRDKKDST